jgi:hypothetical protein
MEPLFTVRFKGHPNVTATNAMTLEVTREDFLTRRGDCIVGILADSACRDIRDDAKAFIRSDGSRLMFALIVGSDRFGFSAYGASSLTLTHPMSMVIRKSTFSCSRTVAVRSTAAANDIPRRMVTKLATGAEGELSAYGVLP